MLIHPKSELIREPALIEPRKKVIGSVNVSTGHPLAPKWLVLFNQGGPPKEHFTQEPASVVTSTYKMDFSRKCMEAPEFAQRDNDTYYWNRTFVIGTNDFAIAFYGVCFSGSNTGSIFTNITTGVTLNQLRLQPHYPSNGDMSFMTYENGFTNATGTFISGEVACFVGARRGTTMELWKNGILLASTTGEMRNVDGGTQKSFANGWATGGNYTHWGKWYMLAAYDRTMSQGEAASLSANPYQFLVPA